MSDSSQFVTDAQLLAAFRTGSGLAQGLRAVADLASAQKPATPQTHDASAERLAAAVERLTMVIARSVEKSGMPG